MGKEFTKHFTLEGKEERKGMEDYLFITFF